MKSDKESFIIGLTVFFAVLALGLGDYNEHTKEQSQYCELVQLWEDSNGENGHPDYKRVAVEWCTDNHITN